jgi:hypothetical protein
MADRPDAPRSHAPEATTYHATATEMIFVIGPSSHTVERQSPLNNATVVVEHDRQAR